MPRLKPAYPYFGSKLRIADELWRAFGDYRIERGSGWTLVLGDSDAILPSLPDSFADVVLTDPPFDERTHKNAKRMQRDGRRNKCGAKSCVPRAGIAFCPIVPAELAPLLVRAAKRWAVSFCALEQLGAYADAVCDAWVRAGAWHRSDGAPQFTGDRPAQCLDGVAVMHRPGPKRWNGRGSRAFWECGTEKARNGQDLVRLSPAQKPVRLMCELVRLFSEPGECVLDPFAGSGTTLVACLREGRSCIGIENDLLTFEAAAERLRAEEAGSTLEQGRRGQLPLW